MRIINVIITGECSMAHLGIVKIKTWIIEDEQTSSEIVEQAEEYFKTICLAWGVHENDVDSYIEDGVFEDEDQAVHLVWSYPENLQTV